MDKEIINLDNEMEQVDKGIIKYQVLLKSTSDFRQKEIYEKRITELKAYKEKILALYETNKHSKSNFSHKAENKSFILEIQALSGEKGNINNEEINTLCLYLNFFYQEFLSIFTERKIRLDVKFSLERDKFHHLYQELARHLHDYLDELNRLKQGKLNKGMESEIKHRNMQKKRILLIESDKFFKRVGKFVLEILNDLNGPELICLNGDDIVNFDLIEGKRYLEGYTVRDGMHKLYNFCIEVIGFLNIPELE